MGSKPLGKVVVWSHLARVKSAPLMLAAIHIESRIMARVKSAPLMLHRE